MGPGTAERVARGFPNNRRIRVIEATRPRSEHEMPETVLTYPGGDHQDFLGDVCDARANIRLIGEFLQRDLPEPVRQDLTAMRTQNEKFLDQALKAGKARE